MSKGGEEGGNVLSVLSVFRYIINYTVSYCRSDPQIHLFASFAGDDYLPNVLTLRWDSANRDFLQKLHKFRHSKFRRLKIRDGNRTEEEI